MPAKSPVENAAGVFSFRIQIEGEDMKDSFGVKSIGVQHAVNEISHATIVLTGEAITPDGGQPMSDAHYFNPGNRIHISAGYNQEEALIFSGVIVAHTLAIDASSGACVRLLCRHAAVAMSFTAGDAVFVNQTDSDIISAIAGKYALAVKVEAVDHRQEVQVQTRRSDWDFIQSLSAQQGFIICMDGEAITIGKPVLNSTPVLLIEYGVSILSFEASISAEYQPTALHAASWDAGTQTLISAVAGEPDLNAQGNLPVKKLSATLGQADQRLISNSPLPPGALKIQADAALLFRRLSAISGKVKFTGNASVKTGSLIELKGVGEKFNGNAFVTGVAHVLQDGAWETTVSFGLQQPAQKAVSITHPDTAMQGLQIATVQKISADPQSNYRVLVQLAAGPAMQQGIWARMAGFYASAAAGAVCYPELGDEVIVGFLEGDSNCPVILGSLYSRQRKPPHEIGDDSNNIKSFTTRSGMELKLDDEKRRISIKTPAGNSIVLSEDEKAITLADQNSNTIQLTQDGIVLTSVKDMILKASGNIVLDATANITVAAKQDVTVTGLNVTQDAQIAFIAKASASAEVSASGQTTVKGAIVLIN